MVLPLLLGVGGLALLLSLFTVIIKPLSLLAGAAAAVQAWRILMGMDLGFGEYADYVNAGLASLTGFVVFKVFGVLLASLGLAAALVIGAAVVVFGPALVFGGILDVAGRVL